MTESVPAYHRDHAIRPEYAVLRGLLFALIPATLLWTLIVGLAHVIL